MMDQTGTYRINYEEVMQGIGHFIDLNNLKDVTIIELKQGIMVKGVSHTATPGGYESESQSFLFTNDDLDRLVNEVAERRDQEIARQVQAQVTKMQEQQQKGGFFKR